MAETRLLFFWGSGMLFPALDGLLGAVLGTFGHFTQADVAAWPPYRPLQEQLALGNINDLEFCKALTKDFQLAIAAEQLREQIIQGFTVNPKALAMIDPIKNHMACWLVVDIPAAWFRQTPAYLSLHHYFAEEKTILLDESGLNTMIPGVFAYLPQRVGVPTEQCLLLDGNMKRTMLSIRYGLPSAIIINPQRLEREFLLRKLILLDYQIHQRPV